MAYVPQNTTEDDPEASNLGVLPNQDTSTAVPTESSAPGGTTPTPATPTQTGGGGVTPVNNGVTSTSQQTGGAQPTGSSQLAQQSGLSLNAQPYINSQANQNAISGSATGITNNLNSETGAATAATTTGTTNLQSGVNAGSAALDTTGNNAIINNPTSITPAQQTELTNELSGTYSGPTSATSYFAGANQPAATAAGNAATLEAGNIAGPETYFAGNGVQGQGGQALDAALFNGSSNAQAAVQPAVLNAQAAQANVSGAELAGQNNIIPEGQANANATQAATQAQINAGIAGYTSQGNAAAAANITAYNQLAQQTTSFLQNPTAITGTPTADQAAALKALGYTVDQWNQLQGAYTDLAKLQYVQNLAKNSGIPITQNASGQFVNAQTGEAINFPANLPPPAGVDLSKGLSVQEASQLFNMGNSASPQIQKDINALEGFLGQTPTSTPTSSTGTPGQQFAYNAPNLASDITAAQTSLTNQNNLNQAAIKTAEANPSAALKGGTTLGVAYAIGGATVAEAVASAALKGNSSFALATGMGNTAANLAAQTGASDATVQAVRASAASVGAALSVIGAAYGIYNFIAGYQSGNSAVDAMNGAEAGAAIGSIVPGIGTAIGFVIGGVVGAVSGLFGYKADPETGDWQSYQQAAIQAGFVNPSSTATQTIPPGYLPPPQLQQLAASDPSPATTFEGLMDVHNDTGIPMYDQYGRMGGGTFLVDMTKQIDTAATKGTINAYSSPQQIYKQVIAPWIATMGTWSNPNSGAIIALVISMIGQYTSGDTQDWAWINGTNYLQQQTKPFSQFVSDTYAPSNWINPVIPGNTTSNPIGANNGPAPTPVAGQPALPTGLNGNPIPTPAPTPAPTPTTPG
jgi:hypothetical protein